MPNTQEILKTEDPVFLTVGRGLRLVGAAELHKVPDPICPFQALQKIFTGIKQRKSAYYVKYLVVIGRELNISVCLM